MVAFSSNADRFLLQDGAPTVVVSARWVLGFSIGTKQLANFQADFPLRSPVCNCLGFEQITNLRFESCSGTISALVLSRPINPGQDQTGSNKSSSPQEPAVFGAVVTMASVTVVVLAQVSCKSSSPRCIRKVVNSCPWSQLSGQRVLDAPRALAFFLFSAHGFFCRVGVSLERSISFGLARTLAGNRKPTILLI